MKRWMFFTYGVACHALFLATFAWLALFVGGMLVHKTVDTPTGDSLAIAVAINLGLMLLFAAQHSIMARPGFKRLWTRIVPRPIERSTYVLLTCAVIAVMIWQWRGIDAVVWNVENEVARAALWSLFAFGWLLVPVVTMMINHFDLFGTRQVWLYLRGQEYTHLPFRTPLLYRRVRHPLYIGWTIAFWATPTMTAGHLLFAVVMTGYMGLAAIVEERDLIAHFGEKYAEYRKHVPMFLPRLTVARPGNRSDRESTSKPVPQKAPANSYVSQA